MNPALPEIFRNGVGSELYQFGNNLIERKGWVKTLLLKIAVVICIIILASFIFFRYLMPKGSFKQVTRSVKTTIKTHEAQKEGYYLSSVPPKKLNNILVETSKEDTHKLNIIDSNNWSLKEILSIQSKKELNPSISHNGEFIGFQKTFHSARQNTNISQISIIDITGKEIDYSPKYQRPFNLNNFRFSPDGSRVAYEFSIQNQTYPEIFIEKELKILENTLITQAEIRIPNPEKAGNHFPQFLSSSKALAFLADFAGSPEICIFDLGLQTPELIRLTNGSQAKAQEKNLFSLDPKEEFLFYVQNAFWQGGEKICVIPTLPQGEPNRRGTINMVKYGTINYTESYQNIAQISQIYKKITQLFISPDGKNLLFIGDRNVITAKINGAKPTNIAEGDFAQLSFDQKRLAIGLNQKKDATVTIFDFETQKEEKKITFPDSRIEDIIWF